VKDVLGSTFVSVLAAALGLSASSSAQGAGTVRSQQRISINEFGILSFGRAVAAVGDVDGDGTVDLAVGANSDLLTWTARILFMTPAGAIDRMRTIDSTDVGDPPFRELGRSLAALGDLDRDGVPDLAVGDTRRLFPAPVGQVKLVFLLPSGRPRAHATILAERSSAFAFGAAVATLGDLDGDGVVDLAIGDPFDGLVQQDGAVTICFLRQDGSVVRRAFIREGVGGFAGPLPAAPAFGASLACLGDLDGDGRPELAVGAPEDGDDGAVWLLSLNTDGTVHAQRRLGRPGPPPFTRGNRFGTSVAALGDVDGNGVVDLAVGAPREDLVPFSNRPVGAVHVLLLASDGSLLAARKIGFGSGGFVGLLQPRSYFGTALAAHGDRDGDGVVDLLVGAVGTDARKGSVYELALHGLATLDFETRDDLVTPLVNGQDLSSPPEFGRSLTLTSQGANLGAAVFDSTPGGPNDPSQDRDLLVGKGHVLVLQNSLAPTQATAGIFDRPNDDQDGGRFTFAFPSARRLLSVDLIDIDAGANQASQVVLFDALGRARVYTVPPGWTEDRLNDGGPGWRRLDLTTLAPQAGFAGTALAAEDAGFAAGAVVRLEVQLGSSGAIDTLRWDPTP